MKIQTEYEFVLPRGYLDPEGNLHRNGRMRLATAMDEIAPLRDPRVRSNEAYISVILLSRVVTKLGDLSSVTTGVIENLFAADMAYLQALYRKINEEGLTLVQISCPECKHIHEIDLSTLGGEMATP